MSNYPATKYKGGSRPSSRRYVGSQTRRPISPNPSRYAPLAPPKKRQGPLFNRPDRPAQFGKLKLPDNMPMSKRQRATLARAARRRLLLRGAARFIPYLGTAMLIADIIALLYPHRTWIKTAWNEVQCTLSADIGPQQSMPTNCSAGERWSSVQLRFGYQKLATEWVARWKYYNPAGSGSFDYFAGYRQHLPIPASQYLPSFRPTGLIQPDSAMGEDRHSRRMPLPWRYPALQPRDLPIRWPVPRPSPLPFRTIPKRKEDPFPESTKRGPAPRPVPRPKLRPESGTSGPGRITLRDHKSRPPGPKTKERKVRFGRGIIAVAGAITEASEFVDALFKSLPEDIVRKAMVSKGKNKFSFNDKFDVLYRNFDKIDTAEAVKNVLLDQIEDTVIGKLSQGSKNPITGRASGISQQADLNQLAGQVLDITK